MEIPIGTMDDRFEQYRRMPPEDFEGYTKFWSDMFEATDPRGLSPDNYIWRFNEEYLISNIGDVGFNYAKWMQAEIDMWRKDGDPDRFDDLLCEDVYMPVIVVEFEGRAHVWDGHHRIGASVLRGNETVPAVIGQLKHLEEKTE